MSISSSISGPIIGASGGTARSAFEAAARTHHAARQIAGGGAQTTFTANLPAANKGQPTVIAEVPVEQAIANASRQTGVDYDYLLAQARVESALDPAAKARTSSASGLFQFIESTWLGTMKRHGARFGLGALAAEIDVTANGTAHVADPTRRKQILGLRNDPQVASWMAAGLAEDNRAFLTPILGRQPDHGELYLAHFLGAGGAGRFLSAMQDNPQQGAASLFASAAAANRPIFFEADGSERSLAGVMHHLGAKIERAMGLAPGGSAPSNWASYPVPVAAASLAATQPVAPSGQQPFSPLQPAWAGGSSTPPRAASAAQRAPLSEVLSAAFNGLSPEGAPPPRAAEQVRRAYQQLRSFGL